MVFLFPILSHGEAANEDDDFKLSFEDLMKVKITTAGKLPERIRDVPASVVVITRKDIEAFGYKTLTEILESIPGLYAIDDYSRGANFGVRGFWSGVVNDNMIILVNGVPQVYDFEGNYPLDNCLVPVEAIDRLEVVRGPMSVIYGNGAFFGAINIITNDFDTQSDEPTNLVSVSLGSENTKKVVLRVEGGKEDFRYVCNASIYDTDGLNVPIGDMGSGYTTGSTKGKLEWTQKYFNFSGTFKGFSLHLNYNESDHETYFAFPTFSDGNDTRLSSTNLSLGYKRKLSGTFTIDGRVNYSHIQDWYKFDILHKDFYGRQEIMTRAFEAELNAFITPATGVDIKTGIYYRAVLDASSMLDMPPNIAVNRHYYLADGDDIVTRAFFSQLTYKPSSNLQLVAGVRLEQMAEYKLEGIKNGGDSANYAKLEGFYTEDKLDIIPRFAAIYYFNARSILKILYGKAINRPSFFQNTNNSFDELKDTEGLEPEWIQTLELNYMAALSAGVTLNAAVFLNTLRNLITRAVEVDDLGHYESWFDNVGKMVTKGVELSLQVRPAKGLTFELSGTLQETDDKSKGFESIAASYSPKFLGYFKAAYRNRNMTFALNGNYVDGMETLWKIDADPAGRIGNKVPGYFDLGANFRIVDFLKKGLFLNIRLSNVLDSEIRYPTYTNNQWANKGTLGHGRAFLVSVGWKF
ncbi:MAG: TonB-dependent receptor [bacterium]|nr:TonB-dependent receptor [bacterium]